MYARGTQCISGGDPKWQMSVEASGPRIVVGQLLLSVMIVDKSLALIEVSNHRLLLPVQYDIRTIYSTSLRYQYSYTVLESEVRPYEYS